MPGRGGALGRGRPWIFALVFLLGSVHGASGQIVGRVMDRATRSGVPEASVLLMTLSGDPVGETVTDSLGTFWFVPASDSATYTLQVVARGTVATPVDPVEYRGEVVRPIVILDSRGPFAGPVTIEGLDVAVDPRSVVLDIFGFYERRERGYGTFLEAEDFRDAPTEDLTQIVRGLPGVLVLGEREILFQRNWKPPSSGMGRARGLSPMAPPDWRDRYCTPSIWINGQPDWRLNDMVRDGEEFERMAGRSVNDFLPKKEDILGIEVYRSLRSVPRELQIEAERLGGNLSGSCGVILIWAQ